MSSTSTTTATPYSQTSRGITEKKRTEACKNIIEDMKDLLIQNGAGSKEELHSQPAVLFKVVKVVTLTDLNEVVPPFKLIGSGHRKEARKQREQYRRDQQDAAYNKLREFILASEVGNLKSGTALEKLVVLQTILPYLKQLLEKPGTSAPAPPVKKPLRHSISSILAPSFPRVLSPSTLPNIVSPVPSPFAPQFSIPWNSYHPLMSISQISSTSEENKENEDEYIDVVGL